MDSGAVVEAFFNLMQARRWRDAEQLLAENVHVEYTATGERFDGQAFLAMNEAYPDGWSLEVVDTIAVADRASTQVVVRHGAEVFWCAGFYTVREGRIVHGVEHWVTEGSETPPEWRRRFTSS
jgi:SnoaL-like domain